MGAVIMLLLVSTLATAAPSPRRNVLMITVDGEPAVGAMMPTQLHAWGTACFAVVVDCH